MSLDNFFVPSLEITRLIINQLNEKQIARLKSVTGDKRHESQEEDVSLLEAFLQSSSKPVSEEDLGKCRQWLKATCYHYFGRLARIHPNGKTFEIRECVVKGMASRLGLQDANDSQVLLHLADEFSAWLNSQADRSFTAGWGTLQAESFESFKLISSVRGINAIDNLVIKSQTPEAKRSAKVVLRIYILGTTLGVLMGSGMFWAIYSDYFIGPKLVFAKVSVGASVFVVLFGVFAIIVLKLRDYFLNKRFQNIKNLQGGMGDE